MSNPVNLIIRSFPGDDHKRLTSQARQDGISLQELCTRILQHAARQAPGPEHRQRATLLILEPEMRLHLAQVRQQVAVRVGAVAAADVQLYSSDELRDAIERHDPDTYLALQQYLNAYHAWWSYHAWLSETGRTGQLSNDETNTLHHHAEQRETQRKILLARVQSVEQQRRG